MIAPVYQPLPYALSGHSFTQLPICIQQYLHNTKLVPPHAPDVNFISAERFNISTALSSSLTINDLNLVKSRLDTIAMAPAQERRLQYVLSNVLPKRERIFSAFMIKFDALDANITALEDWQSYRDARLVALYKAVRTRPVLFGYHNHRLPYSPFGSSRATRGHARSATRGPADRGGRMLSRRS
ncbi:hypothetical protein EDD22DRAFT_889408 [Suillus occidentalis]|nr:hypothetical protein EDD22DRAFT_889408 [Suillus occidentalis]